jgi:hypothetical protein
MKGNESEVKIRYTDGCTRNEKVAKAGLKA